MSKRSAGIWAGKLERMGFNAYRCNLEDDFWSVWCQEAGEHLWEPADVQAFLRWAEGQGIA